MSPFDLKKLQDLKNLELKDIDGEELLILLQEHQHTLIKSFLIIVTLWMLVGMFNNAQSKEKALRAKIAQGQQKLTVLAARNIAVSDLAKFKSSFSHKLTENEFITLVSNYAKSNQVTIVSLSPAESKDMGLYDLLNISLDVVCNDFKQMEMFLRGMEKANSSIRVDSWAVHEGADGQIISEVGISAVGFHP
jgi:hypothetical protein